MSENSTIRQEIVLEDKVTPALDSMLKSIQGATTAMGALLESVERFRDAASNGGFNINFEQTAEAVNHISEAYENAARNAQGFANVAGNIPSVVPPSPNGNPGMGEPVNPAAPNPTPEPSPQKPPESITFASEFEKIRNGFSNVITGLGDKLSPLRDKISGVFDGIGGSVSDKLQSAKENLSAFGENVGKHFSQIRQSAFGRLQPIATIASKAFSGVRKAASAILPPVVRVAGAVFQKIGSVIKSGLSVAFQKIGGVIKSGLSAVKSGLSKIVGMAQGVFGTLIGGGITSAIAGFSKIASLSDARSNSIAQLNQLSEEQRNGYSAAELRNYGVKYANRVGMSSDDFMDQSMQLMNLTGGAFGSIGEAMNYNELMQKQMKISGVDANAANSVAVQWRQGLTEGFASQEINTVLEQAPVLAQRLADTMGIEMGELKDAAAKGEITAEIAKKALFDNAEDINAKFAAMPRTWEQIGATIKNNAAQALDPLLQKVSDLAQNPAIETITDKLISGFTWFADVAGSAFDFVLDTIGVIAPYIEEIATPIKEILFSVWDIIKGLIDDIGEMFTKDEEFGKSAQSIWSDFKSVLDRLKPVVEGFVETIAGGIKILVGVAKNVVTLYENARTGLHNLFSDDELEYQSFDLDVFSEGASQIAGGVEKGVGNAMGLMGDLLTKNLKAAEDVPFIGPTLDMMKDNDKDRIDAPPGSSPSKPLHTKQVGKTKIDKESLQLLKDLAQAEIINRVNNIQPAITANFGDVHETADVDAMLDRLEKDVVSARGQNLMLQTGMQYAL